MILDNPFRRLGLPATASAREIRRRLDELTVKASLGAAPDLPADELSRLRQSLEDPVERARQEIFWLYSPPEFVDPTTDIASSGAELVAALDSLRSAAGNGRTQAQAIALHDLAVLTYGRFLAAGNGANPGDALELWADVVASTPFWEHVQARAKDVGDPRLTPEVVEQIRTELPTSLLEPLAQRAAGQIDAGEFEAAAGSLRTLRRSGLPGAALDAAARAAIAPIRAKVDDGAAAVDRAIEKIPASGTATADTQRRLEAVEKTLIQRVLTPVARLQAVDPVFNDELLGDRAAAAARNVSVAVCNRLDDWVWGYALIREAVEMARTPTYLAHLAGDQAQVCTNYHRTSATDAVKLQRPAMAIAHYELALAYARSDEERIDLRNLAAGARAHAHVSDEQVEAAKSTITTTLQERQDALRRRVVEAAARPVHEEAESVPEPMPPVWKPMREVATGRPARSRRKWLLGVAVVAVVAIVIAIAAAHSGSNSTSASSPPAADAGVAAPAQTPASSAPDCSSLPALSSQLDSIDRQIRAKRKLVRRLDAQIAPVESEINQIMRDYPSHQLPTAVWNRFVPLRAQYKTLVAESNRAVGDGNALISTYNHKLTTYRRLNGEC